MNEIAGSRPIGLTSATSAVPAIVEQFLPRRLDA